MYGQDLSWVRVGEHFDPGENRKTSLVVSDSAGYYLLIVDEDGKIGSQEKPGSAIFFFDKNLNLLDERPVQFNTTVKINGMQPVSFIKTENGFILLCTSYSTINNHLMSFLLLLDENGRIETMLSPGVIEELTETDAEFNFFNLHEIYSTYDSARRYVLTITTPYFLDISERINFIIYDENLEVTGSHLLDYPDDFIDYRIKEILCSKTGFFYIRVEITNPFRDGEKVHQLVVYDMYNDDFNTLELNITDAMVQKSALTRVAEDMIGMSGFYVEGPLDEEPQGLFYYLFRASTGELLKQKIHPFTANEKALINPKNVSSKSSYSNLRPAGLYLTAQNHVLVLFEYNWKSILLIRDQEGMLYDEPFYYANEIFLFRFDASNQLFDSEMISKRQSSGITSDILGFKGIVSEENFYLLYNDNPKNKNEYGASKQKPMKRKYVMMLGKYDLATGAFSKSVFEKYGYAFSFNPVNVREVGQNRFLIVDQSGQPRLLDIIPNQ